MPASDRVRHPWWSGRILRLVLLGAVLIGVSLTLSGAERLLGLGVATLCLAVAAVIVVLGRRDRL